MPEGYDQPNQTLLFFVDDKFLMMAVESPNDSHKGDRHGKSHIHSNVKAPQI